MLKLDSDYLNATKEWIDRQLDLLVPDNGTILHSAARYSLLGGGKRIRPLIVLATTQVLKGDPEAALNPACALEMVHAYSLIHDDLPSMDDDDFRRGKPTLHKVYPESHAILAGDFLLNLSFEVLAMSRGLSADQKLELISILSKAGGSEGMIGGQIMDLDSTEKNLSLSRLQLIHEQKTSALLEAAFTFGAVISHASRAERETLQLFGKEIGLIFQIIDDVLDITEAIGSDKKNNKTTYATLLGVEEARALAQRLHESALKRLASLPYDTALLESLANTLIHRRQ